MHLQSPINLLSIFLLIGGFNGILFAVLLLKLNKQNIFINKYFSLFLIIISLQLLDRFLLETNLVYKFPTMFGLVRILEPLLAPSLYLYIRNITQPNKEYKKTYFHYSSSLLGMVMLSPIFILSIEDKLAITESNFIYWPGILEYTFPIYMIIISIQFSVYIFLSFKLLMKHTKNIRDFFSYKTNITLIWLRNFLLFNMFIWVFIILFSIAYSQSDTDIKLTIDIIYCVSVFSVFYLGIMALIQPRIYQNSEIETKTTTKRFNNSQELSTKYKKSALTNEISTRLLKRLTYSMEVDKPYLDSCITLPKLAKILATSPNYLSQVINQQLNMNFFDYINSYRIKVAKELLINPLPHTQTILDIAMESAFNSKSAFYSAFKKHVGVTPANYKKSLLK